MSGDPFENWSRLRDALGHVRGLRRVTYRITLMDRREKEVKGWLVAPGLGVHRTSSGAWSVTHIGSGLYVGIAYTRQDAITCARLLAGLADWTRPAEELRQSLGDRRHLINSVAAAAEDACVDDRTLEMWREVWTLS